MKNTLKTLLLLVAVSAAGVYRDAGLGLYPFLKMDVGARSASLGGTGSVNGGELSIFSNPALVATAEPSVSVGHNQWYGSTTQNFIAVNANLGSKLKGSLGFRSVTTMDIEYRENPTSQPVDTFNAMDFSFNGAVAAEMGNFYLGAGLKIIHEKIWLESSNGWAVDFGFGYRIRDNLIFTGAYLHSGPEVTMTEDSFRFPRTWVFGSRWDFSLPVGSASISGQVMRPLDNQTGAGFGLEYRVVDWAALRGGWKLNDDSSDLTAGAGLSASGWTFDYAFVPGDWSLGTAHRFTLSRSF